MTSLMPSWLWQGFSLTGEVFTFDLLSWCCALQGKDIDNLSGFRLVFPGVLLQTSAKIFISAYRATPQGPSG